MSYTTTATDHEALVEEFNAGFDPSISLLSDDQSHINDVAVAHRTWYFYLNRLRHHNAFAHYIAREATRNDHEHNLLVATDSAYRVAEEELSATRGQELLALLS